MVKLLVNKVKCSDVASSSREGKKVPVRPHFPHHLSTAHRTPFSNELLISV